METYEIRRGRAADGTEWWAVVQYVGNCPQGADHHWLRPEYAENALSYYQRGGRFPKHPAHVP